MVTIMFFLPFNSCKDVQFGVEDYRAYSRLLGVGVHLKLSYGRVSEALEMGVFLSVRITPFV